MDVVADLPSDPQAAERPAAGAGRTVGGLRVSEIDPYDELKKQMTAAEARFASEVGGATLTVVKDDGTHLHLRFDFPRASWSWCEVVTWPGALTLRGGLGC